MYGTEFSIAAFQLAQAGGPKVEPNSPLITNDAIVLGILLILLALIFWSEAKPGMKRFYTFVPALLLCYFLPGILGTLGIISGDSSQLYFVSSRYLLL